MKSDPLNSRIKRRILYYEEAIKIYKDTVRQEFLRDFLYKEMVLELGFIDETENLLKQYYAEPGYPEYKKYMKEKELHARERKNGKNAPDFVVTDMKGNSFTKSDLKGKIAIMDFWFTGCAGCAQLTPYLKDIEELFKNDTNVVFVSISIDENRDKWLKSIDQKKYTTGRGINLYTGGEGDKHAMIRKYAITGYPSLHLMDPYGRIVKTYPDPDPRKDNGKAMIELVQKQLILMRDGPYIFNQNGISEIYSINGFSVSTTKTSGTKTPSVTVPADNGTTFSFPLRKQLLVEPSEYQRPEKLLILSDIEGNFDAFRKLLQANKVIDDKFNWIFDKGHLVIIGDMVDRGVQVTECLWLIYSLEQKAKEKGGYVHYILGNHEIMNMDGDDRYNEVKYNLSFKLIGKPQKEVYGVNSEIGRWLRTKNIIEKVGDILFVHGGISDEINSLNLTISELNNLARVYYGKSDQVTKLSDPALKFLYSQASPFWDRQLYMDSGLVQKVLIYEKEYTRSRPSIDKINSYLHNFKVNRIITGHTIKSDTVNVHYGGIILNVDTEHADHKNEAVLIENSNYYRVNAEGERKKLFSGPEN